MASRHKSSKITSIQPEEHHYEAYDCAAFRVISGFNMRQSLQHDLPSALGPSSLACGEVYRLDADTKPILLPLSLRANSIHSRADGPLQLDARHLLIDDHGKSIEILRLSKPAKAGTTDNAKTEHRSKARPSAFLLPLSPLEPLRDYTLIDTEFTPDADHLRLKLAAGFLRGSRITLADGNMMAVEQLIPGLQIATRDHGPQELIWIGRITRRASSSAAPLVIPAGRLGNPRPLGLAPEHRLHVFDPEAPQGPCLLLPARSLLQYDVAHLREGGYAEFISLAFREHVIIYAEGVACESLHLSARNIANLPRNMRDERALELHPPPLLPTLQGSARDVIERRLAASAR